MQNQRKASGSFIVSTMVGAMLIVLPLGLYAFEIARVNLAAFQLHAATDSAALAASSYLQYVDSTSIEERAKAKALALAFLERNQVTGVNLSGAKLSSSVEFDNPAREKAHFNLVFNRDNSLTAVAAFGLQPAFAGFLGLNSVPIRVNSSAGASGLLGDICLVVDLSGSMTEASKSVLVSRVDDGVSVTHTAAGSSTLSAAFSPAAQVKNLVPDPDTVDFSKTQLLKDLQNANRQVKLAALLEAKLGNLENQGIFNSSHANNSALKTSNLSPQRGYQDEYQKLALSATQPLYDAKAALSEFVSLASESAGAHFSLISFSSSVSSQEGHDSFSTRSSFRLPRVNLHRNESRSKNLSEALEPAPAYGSTNTGDAVLRASEILTGDQHRKGAAKTIVLLTDGLANTGSDPVLAAKEAGKKGIKLMTIGFFHSKNAQEKGQPLLNAMAAAAGNGSKAFFAPDIPSLKEILAGISRGEPSLINR